MIVAPIINVIKHSEGLSERKLRILRPNLFIEETEGHEYDLMSMCHTSLQETTLKINISDFYENYNTLVTFWKSLPERMYGYDLIIEEINRIV